jgi:Spy/CpxP family protein refolding chaperone
MTKRFLMAGGAVALLATGLVFAQGQGRGRGQMAGLGGPMGAGLMGPEMSGRMLQRLARYLDLTEAQQADARKLFEAARTEAAPLVKTLAGARQTYHDAIRTSANGADAAAKAKGVLDENRGAAEQLLLLHARTMGDFRALLTPEQKEKLDKLRDLFGPRRARSRAQRP